MVLYFTDYSAWHIVRPQGILATVILSVSDIAKFLLYNFMPSILVPKINKKTIKRIRHLNR